MTLEETILLVRAGFTRDEIAALGSDPAATPEPVQAPVQAPAAAAGSETIEAPRSVVTPEPTQAPNNQLTDQANALLNILQGVPIPPKVSIDDKLTAILKGLIVGEKKGE